MFHYVPSISSHLETQSIQAPTPLQPPPITIVKPISYQFQVAEYEKDGKIVKVELQVQMTFHDEYGKTIRSSGFVAVPRVKLPFVDHT